MAITTTLADLRTRFYARFDEGSQNYIGTTEANVLLNEGGAHLHNWIVNAAEYYIWKTFDITPVNGTIDYALPTDFLKDLKVFGVSNGYYEPLRRLMPQEFRGGQQTDSRLFLEGRFGYMIMGQTLRIQPAPSNVLFTLEMWYTPHYTALVADSDVMNVSVAPGWDEFVVNQAVIAARLKEESDTAPLERRQAEIRSMIEQDMINRDMGQTPHVVDRANTLWPWGLG